MSTYQVEVVETQLISRTYLVEADSIEQAEEKASIGDTVNEWDLVKYGDVVDREVLDIQLDEENAR